MWMWGEFYCIMLEYECMDCKLLSKYCDLIKGYKLQVKIEEGTEKKYCEYDCLIKLKFYDLRYGKGRLRLVK